MPSALDRDMDAVIAAVTGPGGMLEATGGPRGQLTAAKLPPVLPQMLDMCCGLHRDVVAVVAGEEELTFGELGSAAHRAAQALVGAHGVKPGDRVAIAMRNAPAWVVLYMAVLKAGGIATLVNGWWERDELAHALALTAPTLVLADAPRARRIADAGWTGEVLVFPIERSLAEALAPLGEAEAALPAVTPDMDATILFTSGSTGDAKGAVSTHGAVTAAVYNFASAIGSVAALLERRRGGPMPHPPRALIGIPFFHVTGAVPLMLLSFVIGRGMVLMPKWDAGEALRLIERHRVTYFLGVPTMSLELSTHPDRETRDLSSLTDVAAGGAPRPVAHVERLRDTMAPAQPGLGYGLTETNAVGCTNFWENYVEKPASTGRAQPFVELAIFDENHNPLPAGAVGEVAIRARANMRGYWRNPEATAKAINAEGWFVTGDLGMLDEDGYLFIVDRKKDVIIRGGENISAQEVESAISQHPEVAEVSVFGVDDERLGEVPGAVLHLQPGSGLDADGLQSFLSGRLARFKVPERLWFHPEPLPKLGTGKIDKVSLRARYRGAGAA